MRRLWLISVLLLGGSLPAPAQVGLVLGQDCAGGSAEGRACLSVESSLRDLTDLRNEITRGMAAAGGGDCGGVSCYVLLICDQCSVDKKVDGCSLVNDRVVMSRWSVMSHRIGCLLTAVRAQGLERAVQARALERLDRRADIGMGYPQLSDERSGDGPPEADEPQGVLAPSGWR